MNTLIRWGKFNLVGAMGMGVQLASLALLNRCIPGHYLVASAAAVELTLLHNFVWHMHYTWRDRCGRDRRAGAPWLRPFVRFQLSNGLVSLVGNVALMRLLVHGAHLPVLASNLLAILSCSVANFAIGNSWAFAAARRAEPPRSRIASIPSVALLLPLLLLANARTNAQAPAPSLPTAPQPAQSSYHPRPNDSYTYNAGVFCGVGASTSRVATKPTGGCGAGITFVPLPVFLEVGVMGPQANRSSITGYISVDGTIPLAPLSSKILPLAIIGYSRLFETGHSFDYGLALALPRPGEPKNSSDSLRIELRDYWTFANPTQHNVMLRIGWMSEVHD